MSPDIEDLARRAVACPGWRWMPRMVDQYGNTVLEVVDGTPVQWADGVCVQDITDRGADVARRLWAEAIPDFDDAATRGCLLALVREAWGDDCMHAEPERDAWRVWRRIYPMGIAGAGPTEAAALVAALEAAPVTP